MKVVMDVEGMKIKPCGDVVAGTGHRLINRGPMRGGKVIPTDKTDLRCGNGQTGATIELALGDCTLTMQFTDGFHVSFGKKMAHSIRIKLVSPK